MAKRQVDYNSLAEAIHRAAKWSKEKGPAIFKPWRPWEELTPEEQDDEVSKAEYILSLFNVYRK